MNPFHLALAGAPEPAGACWPGFAPAGEVLGAWVAPAGRGWPGGHSLSFASPKERKQRKSEPAVCDPALRFGQPAVLAPGRGALELASLKQSRALISLKLCSSAQTEGPRTTQSARLVALRATLPDALTPWLFNTARAKQSAVALAAVEAGLSSAGAGGKRAGDCLSEASSSQRVIGVRHQFRCDALRRTLRASRQARRIWALTPKTRHRAAARTSARLFFGYFHLAKQKKVARPPGRDPASGSKPTSQSQQNHTPCRHAACVQ